MADLQEVSAGGIREIRQVDPEGFTIVTLDDRIYRITLPPGVVGPMGPRGMTGPAGPAGDMGSPGADGRDGRDGMNGNDGSDGIGVDFAQVLKDGSLALMLSTGDVINCGSVVGPKGDKGDRGMPGVPGPAGADGSQIYLTSGAPDGSLGKADDIAIDVTSWKLYRKTGAGWGSGNEMVPSAKTLDQAIRSFNGSGGGGGKAPRYFGMGAPSAGIAVGQAPTSAGGLEEIIGHGRPLGANIWNPVAIDNDGDLMEVTMFFSRSGGNEVYTCKVIAYRANTIGNLTIAWESAQPLSLPYTVEFNAVVTGQALQLNVRSSVGWEVVRGKINKL